jgi:hypothetical protein
VPHNLGIGSILEAFEMPKMIDADLVRDGALKDGKRRKIPRLGQITADQDIDHGRGRHRFRLARKVVKRIN